MKKKVEQTQEQKLEIVKAVAQAWLAHTTTTSPPAATTNEFDACRLNFKNKPTRFKLEAMTIKPSRVHYASHKDGLVTASWDFKQSLWDSYELVAVSRRLETSLISENKFNETSKGQARKNKKKESKNSLRNVLFRTSSRRFDEQIPS